MKQCTECGEWKEFSEFLKRKYSKDGYRHQCKECKRKYLSKYRKDNKEKIKKCKKEYYYKNKEIILKNYKTYYKNNKYKIFIITKKYSNSFVLWNSIYTEQIKPYEKIRQNGEYLEVKCAYCGDWFIPKITEIHHRLSAINGTGAGEARLYCSNKCKKECPTFKKQKYPEKYKKATSREVQPELRQMVLLRDNYTCQICEKHKDELETGLHCHHYEGILWNPIESADIDACITLCKKCHKEVHKLPNCSYNDMKCKNIGDKNDN